MDGSIVVGSGDREEGASQRALVAAAYLLWRFHHEGATPLIALFCLLRMGGNAMETELLDAEAVELNSLETKVREGFRKGLEAFAALKSIRDLQLYKVRGFKSFDKYCQQEFGIKRDYADRNIVATGVLEKVLTLGSTFGCAEKITTERQCRELLQVPDEKLGQVLEEIDVLAEEKQKPNLPANLIREAVKRVVPEREPKQPVASASDEPVTETKPQGTTVVLEDRPEPDYIRNNLTSMQIARYSSMGLESLRHLIRHMSQFGFYEKYEDTLDQIEAEFLLAREMIDE